MRDTASKPGLTNDHWDSYDKLCHFCQIPYDYIGSFDNIEEDIDDLLWTIFPEDKEHWFPSVQKPQSAASLKSKYFSQLPVYLIEELEETFRMDFELFNFERGAFNNL